MTRSNSGGVCFGIDLGTSNCSVAYVVNAPRRNVALQPKVVEFPFGRDQAQRSPRFPSVIARKGNEKDGRKAAFGFDAQERNRLSDGVDVFRSLKSQLGTLRSYLHAYLEDFKSPVRAWGILIERLCELAAGNTPNRLDPRKYPTVLTVPASFDFQRRQETLDAAVQAGFDRNNIKLIDEPIAALIDWLSSPDADVILAGRNGWTNILVFDFGGGTCDLSLVAVRYAEGGPLGFQVRNLTISPYRVLGGDTIDLAVMEAIWLQIEEQNHLRRGDLTARDRKRVEDANRLTCRYLKESMCEALGKLDTRDRQRDAWGKVTPKSRLLRRVELSTGQTVAGRVEMTAPMFHQLMLPFMSDKDEAFRVNDSVMAEPFAHIIEQTLAGAGMSPSELHVILLHGGSCKNPLVRDALEQLVGGETLFGQCKVTQTPDLDTSVARGAAVHGHYLHHENTWLVHPIVADAISIMTRGDVCETLIPENTALPFPQTGFQPFPDRFVTSQDKQKRMLIPLCVGQTPDGVWPRVAASMSFDLPPDLPAGHPIEVCVRVNEDKLTELQFRPKGLFPWTDIWGIDDPWVRQLCGTDEQEQLLARRAQIRRQVEAHEPVAAWLRAEEARRAVSAGQQQEGLVLIENLLDDQPDDAAAWNIKGLIYSHLNNQQARCDCYGKAARLDPSNAVYCGNFGTALCDLGRYQEAVLKMREALAMDSTLRYLHSWLATAFEHLKQPDEVTKELNRWLEGARRQTGNQPESLEAWGDLEMVCRRLGHYDEADEAQRKIVHLSRTRHVGGSPDDLLTSARW
ncbi:MAG: Hsp70 family protein [Phycisphaeraceae bacterium]|nr:Hsp70 family protein [Phycisphaeraceae bacterium]